jgi:hypothetical protein
MISRCDQCSEITGNHQLRTIPDEETGGRICGQCWIDHRHPGPGPGYEQWAALLAKHASKPRGEDGACGARREDSTPRCEATPDSWVQTDNSFSCSSVRSTWPPANRRIGVGKPNAQAPQKTDCPGEDPASGEEPSQADLAMLDDAFAGDLMAEDRGDLGGI